MLEHPGDIAMPRMQDPPHAWLSPWQQNQTPAQGIKMMVLQVEVKLI